MLPCGIVLVLSGLQIMAECNPGVMRGLFVIARLVMLGGFTMMFGSLVIVFRCKFVMLVDLCALPFFCPSSPDTQVSFDPRGRCDS